MILIILILGNIFNQLPMSTIFAIKYSSDLCEILRNVFGIETFKGFHFKYIFCLTFIKTTATTSANIFVIETFKGFHCKYFSVSHILKLQQQLHVRC